MAVKTGFQGFPEDLFGFLEELAANNNRDWFNEHKPRYRASVVEPMSDFIRAIAPGLRDVSAHFTANPKAHGGSMFRIYRDARFSKDKRPYKTNAGCHFRHEAGRDAHAPGFYVHLEPGTVFVGGGMWKPPGPVLNRVRTAIAENPGHWHKATRSKAFRNHFGELGGESLVRPPRGYDAGHPCIEDLKRKSFFALHYFEPEQALNPGFTKAVLREFSALSPFMDFLTYSQDLPY